MLKLKNKQMKQLFLIFFVFWNINIFSQNTNERLIYSFKTKKGKLMRLTLDTVKNVMIYRYGTENKTELEKRDDLNDNKVVFTYSYYFRGGPGNAGLDLNYVEFKNGGFTYIIYDEYSADDDSRDVGIRLINNINKKKYTINALPESINGDLSVIRDEEFIPVKEETDEE